MGLPQAVACSFLCMLAAPRSDAVISLHCKLDPPSARIPAAQAKEGQHQDQAAKDGGSPDQEEEGMRSRPGAMWQACRRQHRAPASRRLGAPRRVMGAHWC